MAEKLGYRPALDGLRAIAIALASASTDTRTRTTGSSESICSSCSALDSRSWTARALALAPLVWVGRISYSLYLWHFPILVWTAWEGLGGWRATAAVAMAVAAASASYYFVEQRFRRRRHARAPLLGVPVAAESG